MSAFKCLLLSVSEMDTKSALKKTSVCAGPWTEGVKMGSFQVNLAQARLAMADVVQSYEEIRRPVHSGLLSSGKQLAEALAAEATAKPALTEAVTAARERGDARLLQVRTRYLSTFREPISLIHSSLKSKRVF